MNRKLQTILTFMFIAFNGVIAEGLNTNLQETKTNSHNVRDALKGIIGASNTDQEPNGVIEVVQRIDVAQSEESLKEAEDEDSETLYELGGVYLEGRGDITRDVPKALDLLTRAAKSGNGNAMLELASIHQRGDGIERDQSKAIEWLRKAAEGGEAMAMLALAEAGYEAQDPNINEERRMQWVKKGLKSLEEAAGMGDCDAMRLLGMAYQPVKVMDCEYAAGGVRWFSMQLLCTHIPEINKDEGKSAEWYRQAASGYEKRAAAGDSEAMYWLGKMYEWGLGVKEDVTKGLDWYRKAAEAGHREGMVEHGWACHRAEDFDNAFNWFNEAAEQGNAEAMLSLGWLYSKGQGVPKDKLEAVKWWRMAADRGHPKAMLSLGAAYANGEGVDQDYRQAVTWYKKGADGGDATCMFGLGLMYSTGRGIASDPNEAIEWWTRGAEKQHTGCMANLGWIYLYGKGVTQDQDKAKLWLRKAADLGNEYAETRLKEIGEIR